MALPKQGNPLKLPRRDRRYLAREIRRFAERRVIKRPRNRAPSYFPVLQPLVASVALDAKSTAQSDSATAQTSADHTNLTVGASLSNGALTFIAIFDTKTVSGITLTWDTAGGSPTNQAMASLGTPVSTSGSFGLVALFGLLNPTSGNKTLHAAWTGSAQVSLYGISWTGVDQTNIATAFPRYNTAAATSNTASVVITSATGNAAIAGFVAPNQALIIPTQTELFNDLAMTNINAGGQRAAGAASITLQYGTSGGTPDTWAVAGVDIKAAGATTLVPSWYSPFDPPTRLLARPAGFADLETNIATQAVPPKQFQPFFDRVGLIPRPAGFVDQQAALNTIAQPIKQFPAFDPPSVLKKVQPGFVDLEVTAAAVTPVRVFAPFDPPRSLTRSPAGFVEQPAPLPAVSVPMQAVAFDGPVRLRQSLDWQQLPVPAIAPAIPPVFALAPSFDPPMRLLGLRVIETGFAYAPQVIVQPSITLEIHNLPFHVTMGKLKSF